MGINDQTFCRRRQYHSGDLVPPNSDCTKLSPVLRWNINDPPPAQSPLSRAPAMVRGSKQYTTGTEGKYRNDVPPPRPLSQIRTAAAQKAQADGVGMLSSFPLFEGVVGLAR